jgi:flagellar hook-associated protein 2
MAELSSVVSSGGSQLDLLVDAYVRTQQPKVNQLQSKQNQLESRRNFFNTLNGRLNNIVTQLDKFSASAILDKFNAKSVTSSDATFITASSKGSSQLNSYSAKIERLASSDILISSQLSLTGAFGESAGSKSLGFIVNGETVTVNVEFDGTETNEQAMRKIVTAVNETTDLGINATFVKDSTSTGRISFSSTKSGAENSIDFNDSDVFAKIGLDKAALGAGTETRTLSSDSAAGFKTVNFNDLDSRFELNGITITRGTNTIDDVIDGITFNLLKVQEADANPISLKTEVNTKAVEDFIKPLLTAFNELLTLASQDKSIRRSDTAISSLIYTLRDTANSNQLPDAEEGVARFLSDIGVKFESNGTLSLTDTTKLKELLVKDPEQVANLFIGENAFIAKLQTAVEKFQGDDGLIKSRTSSLNSQIELAKKRNTELQSRIETQANNLRKEYKVYLETLYKAESQYSLLGTFNTNGMNSGYNTLL